MKVTKAWLCLISDTARDTMLTSFGCTRVTNAVCSPHRSHYNDHQLSQTLRAHRWQKTQKLTRKSQQKPNHVNTGQHTDFMSVSLWQPRCTGCRVAESSTCDHEVEGSNLTCVPMSTQRAIHPWLVYKNQWKLGSKQAYHVMHYTCIHGLAASASVQLQATEKDQCCLVGPWCSGKTLLLLFILR